MKGNTDRLSQGTVEVDETAGENQAALVEQLSQLQDQHAKDQEDLAAAREQLLQIEELALNTKPHNKCNAVESDALIRSMLLADTFAAFCQSNRLLDTEQLLQFCATYVVCETESPYKNSERDAAKRRRRAVEVQALTEMSSLSISPTASPTPAYTPKGLSASCEFAFTNERHTLQVIVVYEIFSQLLCTLTLHLTVMYSTTML